MTFVRACVCVDAMKRENNQSKKCRRGNELAATLIITDAFVVRRVRLSHSRSLLSSTAECQPTIAGSSASSSSERRDGEIISF